MATIKSYTTAKGLRYKVRYMKPDGSQGSKSGFTTKEAALDWSSRVEVRKTDGEYVDPRHGRVTVDSLAGAWLAAKRSTLKPSAYDPLDSAWRIHVKPRWGHWQLGRIEISDVEEWITELVTEVRDPADPETILDMRNTGAVLGAVGLVVMAGGIALMRANDRSGLEVGAWSAIWLGLLAANGYLAWRRRHA